MPPPDEPDIAAAELALGLLDGEERTAALRRLARDPDFAADVERWRDWFGALFADWPEVAAPQSLASRIEASLDGKAATPANDNMAWRRLALVTSFAALLLLGVTMFELLRPLPAPVQIAVRMPAPAPAPLLAAIAPTGGGAPLAAAYDPARATVRITGALPVPAGRSAELWAIRGKEAPRSLGLVAGGPTRLVVPAAARQAIAADTVLAISIEPVGGSPTGLPTGPVVATGTLTG